MAGGFVDPEGDAVWAVVARAVIAGGLENRSQEFRSCRIRE